MAETIRCPSCNETIEVTEVLSAQLRAEMRREFEADFRSREAELNNKDAELASERKALAAQRSAIEDELAQRLSAAKKKLKAKAFRKAREKVAIELQAKQAELAEIRGKLQEAQQLELQLRQDRRQLEQDKQALELNVNRRLDEERNAIREKAKTEAGEQHRLRVAEKDETIRGLCEQIEILKRKSEQGSQQLQGEVLEIDMESILRQHFPADDILPVPKGVEGADAVQLVRDSTGGECGTILWETKRTKKWNNEWLAKLRKDQRTANAHVAILVSDELPKSVTTLAYIDCVWVSSRACCVGLAIALRNAILDIAAARRALDGQQDKMEVLYEYLSSSAFRNRVTGIVEAFTVLRQDLEAEKKAISRLWAKRERQVELALGHTAGMYGDLQGIIGGHLPTIEPLELPAPPTNGDEPELMSAGVLPR